MKAENHTSVISEVLDILGDSGRLLIYPKTTIRTIIDKEISIKAYFSYSFFIASIHFYLLYIQAHLYKNCLFTWHPANILGLWWQVYVFVLFITVVPPLILDCLASVLSQKNMLFTTIFKIYLHTLLIFAFYPVINIILTALKVRFSFSLPGTIATVFTYGQIFEAIYLIIITIIILHIFYKNMKAVILSTIFIGFLFPGILLGQDIMVYVMNNFLNLNYSSMSFESFYRVPLWGNANIWFVFLFFIGGVIYLIYTKKLKLSRILFHSENLLINFTLIYLVFVGFSLGGRTLPLGQLIYLFFAVIFTWNFSYLHLFQKISRTLGSENNIPLELQLNSWEQTIVSTWIIIGGLSFILNISIFSFVLINGLIILSIVLKSSKIIHFRYIYIGVCSFFVVLMSSSSDTFASSTFPLGIPTLHNWIFSSLIGLLCLLGYSTINIPMWRTSPHFKRKVRFTQLFFLIDFLFFAICTWFIMKNLISLQVEILLLIFILVILELVGRRNIVIMKHLALLTVLTVGISLIIVFFW